MQNFLNNVVDVLPHCAKVIRLLTRMLSCPISYVSLLPQGHLFMDIGLIPITGLIPHQVYLGLSHESLYPFRGQKHREWQAYSHASGKANMQSLYVI